MGAVALAVAAHPDDIEFGMAGTLLLLKRAGCTLHYMIVANGSCGTAELPEEQIVAVRKEESKKAAEYLGAAYHTSLCSDIQIFYEDHLIRKLTAVVREAEPDIMLIPSLEDYMEDHMITARLAVTAAFCRSMKNYPSIPELPPIEKDLMLYHAMPAGLTDGMRRRIVPELYVDVGEVMDGKERMLACHESQKSWLDKSQGMDSYLHSMREMTKEVGGMSGKYCYAEGWRRHSHLGYSSRDGDPLRDLLSKYCSPSKKPETP
jgi:LmbE family N-acetylglucosaminyl deacetylase